MSAATINEDGSPVLIEAVYYRYHSVYATQCDSVEDATGTLCAGEDDGNLSSVGVFVDGEPRLVDVYCDPHPPTEAEAKAARESYAKRRGQ